MVCTALECLHPFRYHLDKWLALPDARCCSRSRYCTVSPNKPSPSIPPSSSLLPSSLQPLPPGVGAVGAQIVVSHRYSSTAQQKVTPSCSPFSLPAWPSPLHPTIHPPSAPHSTLHNSPHEKEKKGKKEKKSADTTNFTSS